MPHIVIIAGPNGAGKSTSAPALLDKALHIKHFVNADAIAAGLSAFAPEKAAIQAGKAMLKRLRNLAETNENFAFETTLATRSFAPWISELRQKGYTFHLFFMILESPELAVQRVRERVRLGGHNVPLDTIHRRFKNGLANYFNLYQPIADFWQMYDNSGISCPLPVAQKLGDKLAIYDSLIWQKLLDKHNETS
jgi:predicted ABC-type ATPase